jgi:hypothetical protein
VLQLVPHIFISSAQTKSFGLDYQSFTADQGLRRPLSKVREQHLRLGAALGELLAQHLPRLALHVNGGHRITGHVSHNALARPAHSEAVADTAPAERHHHGSANDQQHCAENNFLERTLGLQKSNHCLLTPVF